MATVLPTIQNRVAIYDIARGVAVLGILLANIASFAYPSSDMFAMTRIDSFSVAFDALAVAFVNGKFRTMLAILFGVGLYAQFKKRGYDRNLWPGGYLKRSVILLAIGTCHLVLIWFGDILTLYAVTAFIVAFLVGVSDTVIKRIWVAALAYSVVIGGLLGLLIAFIPNMSASAMGLENESVIYGQGTYLGQLQHRGLTMLPYAGAQIGSFLPVTIALFLLGVFLARRGVLVAPSAHPKERNWMLWLGFGVGLPLNLVSGALATHPKWAAGAQMWTELATGPLQGIGYLILLAIVVEKFKTSWLRPVQNVGRMALTSYLSQSVMATALFYSWGAGWFETVDPAKILGAIAIIWGVNLVFAWAWLKRFDIGPVEWLLRSLTEGKRLPWRFEPAPGPKFEA